MESLLPPVADTESAEAKTPADWRQYYFAEAGVKKAANRPPGSAVAVAAQAKRVAGRPPAAVAETLAVVAAEVALVVVAVQKEQHPAETWYTSVLELHAHCILLVVLRLLLPERHWFDWSRHHRLDIVHEPIRIEQQQ